MFVAPRPRRAHASCCATSCWQDTNIPVLVGLGFLLGGLYTATKWH